MPKGRSITFRPSVVAEEYLDGLCSQTERSMTAVLDGLILDAWQRSIGPEPVPENPPDKVKSAPVARKRLSIDYDKVAAFQRKAGMDIYDAKKRRRG